VLRAYAAARPATDSGTTPLQAAVRTAVVKAPDTLQIVLFTDDTDRAGVGEAVSEARRGEHRLEVFLALSVLFERDTLADLSEATERYRELESFRRDLVVVDHVSAYEIAPRSRIEAVLERRREMEATGR
jgi:F0F1-type ATP synthase delta subunit